jgi:hypothetical protein
MKQHIYTLCQSLFISCLIFHKILQAVLDTNLFKDIHMVDHLRVVTGIKLRFRLLLVSATWVRVLPGMPHSLAICHGVYITCHIVSSILYVFFFFLFCYFVFILLLHWKFHWYYSQALGITSVPPSFSFFLIPVPWLVGPTWLFRALASGFHCRVGSITDLI